jgi:hypothetical protein
LIEHDAGLYAFINQGMLKIDNVDDEQEMKDTKKAFDILLFTEVNYKLFVFILKLLNNL